MKKQYLTHRYLCTPQASFDRMVDSLLSRYRATAAEGLPVRMVFFGSPLSNAEYLHQLSSLRQALTAHFADNAPTLSYVAQPPYLTGLQVEIHEVHPNEDEVVRYKQLDNTCYITLEGVRAKRLFVSGLAGDPLHTTIRQQAQESFAKLSAVMHEEQMPLSSIVRQWNYVEGITLCDADGHQHYQDMNDARALCYEQTEWERGYPAATGIGTSYGGITVDADALQVKDTAELSVYGIDNPLQVAAHAYSQQVLLGTTHLAGRSTPKFERAKAIWDGTSGWVYVSGTSAIRGEKSLHGATIEEETLATLENIAALIAADNLQRFGVPATTDATLQSLRVYVKSHADLQRVRTFISARHPDIPAIYMQSDICRSELPLEIEGTAVIR
jgi:enamine deaminase RidA (YjgF/YER057c/UK114 family)